jgi:CDP-glucose 4,6-dehydratase
VEFRKRAVEGVDVTGQPGFWRGRRVLLTGHTGFKGAWAALWLERQGADVTGFALPPEGRHGAFSCLGPWARLRSVMADVRDAAAVRRVVEEAAPEVVVHMAAQAIVRRSYRDPLETFDTNVMGTAHVLAAAERAGALSALLVVTSDKVYENRNAGRPFREDDPLGGDDPYSASKAAAEAVVRGWRHVPSGRGGLGLGVARGGNVIGGGDWGEDRLVPDVVRAGAEGRKVALRYPDATRPWQHVLDVIDGYAAYAERLATEPAAAPAALNFGPPSDAAAPTVADLVGCVQAAFGWSQGWTRDLAEAPPEKSALSLDAGLADKVLGWRPRLDMGASVSWTAAWYRAQLAGEDMRSFSLEQIERHAALPPARVRSADVGDDDRSAARL